MKKGKGLLFPVILIFTVIFLFAAPACAAKNKAKPKQKPIIQNVSETENSEDQIKQESPLVNVVYVADIFSVKDSGCRVKRLTNPNWMQGQANMPAYVKDVIETDSNGGASMEFFNGSQIGINKSTMIELASSKPTQDITMRGDIEKLILKSGVIWVKTTGQRSNTFEIETGKGTVEAMGIEFIVEHDPSQDTDKITVLEGEVLYKTTSGASRRITPGEELTNSKNNACNTKKGDVSKIRRALSLQFPGLNPVERTLVRVFAHFTYLAIPGSTHALSVARETLSFVEDPEDYLKYEAESEMSRALGVSVHGILGRKSSRSSNPEKINNLSPDDKEVTTYFPDFFWDKVKGAAFYRVIVTRKPIRKGVENPDYVACGDVTDNYYKYPQGAKSLQPNETYYWTVIPLNKSKKPSGRASDAADFKVAKFETLGIKGLCPTGKIEQPGSDIAFDWTPLRGVKKYKIDISSSENMRNPFFSKETDINCLIVDSAKSLFSRGNTYFWQVTPLETDENTPKMSGVVNSFTIMEEAGGKK